MHPYVELAKKTVEEYVKMGKISPIPEKIPADMQKKQEYLFQSRKKVNFVDV